jgi:hypothetical protein
MFSPYICTAKEQKVSRILNVDFKKKRLEYTWDDLARQRLAKQIELELQSVLNNIVEYSGRDKTFQEQCAHKLAQIVVGIKERT